MARFVTLGMASSQDNGSDLHAQKTLKKHLTEYTSDEGGWLLHHHGRVQSGITFNTDQ